MGRGQNLNNKIGGLEGLKKKELGGGLKVFGGGGNKLGWVRGIKIIWEGGGKQILFF